MDLGWEVGWVGRWFGEVDEFREGYGLVREMGLALGDGLGREMCFGTASG